MKFCDLCQIYTPRYTSQLLRSLIDHIFLTLEGFTWMEINFGSMNQLLVYRIKRNAYLFSQHRSVYMSILWKCYVSIPGLEMLRNFLQRWPLTQVRSICNRHVRFMGRTPYVWRSECAFGIESSLRKIRTQELVREGRAWVTHISIDRILYLHIVLHIFTHFVIQISGTV